jgi:hypothetical protein
MSKRVRKLLDYLERETDFLVAPASSKYHGAYEGGLHDHSWNVVNQLRLLTIRNNLKWERPDSCEIVGLAHDMCKLNSYFRNKDGTFYAGYSADKRHGAKSVELVKQIIDITDEEEMCIRWHMGAFDSSNNWNKFTEAILQYPNVLWTHQADMIASKIKEDIDLNLCPGCIHKYPDCNETRVTFGHGIGNDNIICCPKYRSRYREEQLWEGEPRNDN